jgi:hypothetical protein
MERGQQALESVPLCLLSGRGTLDIAPARHPTPESPTPGRRLIGNELWPHDCSPAPSQISLQELSFRRLREEELGGKHE